MINKDKKIYFGAKKLDRASHLRNRTAELKEMQKTHDSKYIPVYNGKHIYMNQHSSFYRRSKPFDCESMCFLGLVDDQIWYSCPLNEEQASKLEEEVGEKFSSLRRYALKLNDELAHIALYSRGLDLWQRNRQYCPKCGTKNSIEMSGHKLLCKNNHEQFPHIEPAIIVLVTHKEKCLLGRKAIWPKNAYSTLAGFVEPGETIEEAVKREVEEESNIRVHNVQYFGSQPWPFPASLMLAFTAEAENEDIKVDDELEDVQWFTRKQLQEMFKEGYVTISPRYTVAHNLIVDWLEQKQ
ncbi:MAG: NAD(+) diphosphatase [Alcanivoracaceae bacterium]|nr:NAD(+) diphosphatase [Alcanivoracaceae bacterium]